MVTIVARTADFITGIALFRETNLGSSRVERRVKSGSIMMDVTVWWQHTRKYSKVTLQVNYS
jgi:hypothetical protein